MAVPVNKNKTRYNEIDNLQKVIAASASSSKLVIFDEIPSSLNKKKP